MLLGARALGFDSAIATSFNVFPHLGLEIFDRAITDPLRALQNQQELTVIVNKMCKFGNWVEIWKGAMNSLTPINVGSPRAPLKGLSEDEVTKMVMKIKN